MAPRRQNYARSRSTSYNMPPQAPIPPPPPNQDLMPPTSRYLHNLRVIQRHDPSITSLFDQFPHVCVYHHKGDEWRKKGCEGAMFLFEREQEPKYGFYILNRNNTGDYIQRMTPNDDVEFASAYLIYRAYGKVTSDTIGLWTMVTQDREAMSQVMMRLHSYIKRNVRYPDEYRRRPDTWSTTPAPVHAQAFIPPPPPSVNDSSSTSMYTLSALLAKLGGPSDPPTKPSPPSRGVSASVPPPATGIPLLDSIFASASEIASADSTPQKSPPGENVFQSFFANGVKPPSSTSTPCGPTPTQRLCHLPSPPPRVETYVNGIHSSSEKNTFPFTSARNGKEPASLKSSARAVTPSLISEINKPPTISEESQHDDEEDWEEEVHVNGTVNSPDDSSLPSVLLKHRARKARRKERERERKRLQKAASQTVDGDAGGRSDGHIDWPLVDDRSLSMDEESDKEQSVGLGDGLLNALSALSEPEITNGRSPDPVLERSSGSKRKKERGKDRWKRKQRELGESLESGAQGDAEPRFQPEIREALLDAYGRRRRVGDNVLDEDTLAKEVVELIQTDPTFVRELYLLYIRKVQV